jgi:hypothetical protein
LIIVSVVEVPQPISEVTNVASISLERVVIMLPITVGLAVRAGIQGTSSRNHSPDLVEAEVKFF